MIHKSSNYELWDLLKRKMKIGKIDKTKLNEINWKNLKFGGIRCNETISSRE